MFCISTSHLLSISFLLHDRVLCMSRVIHWITIYKTFYFNRALETFSPAVREHRSHVKLIKGTQVNIKTVAIFLENPISNHMSKIVNKASEIAGWTYGCLEFRGEILAAGVSAWCHGFQCIFTYSGPLWRWKCSRNLLGWTLASFRIQWSPPLLISS